MNIKISKKLIALALVEAAVTLISPEIVKADTNNNIDIEYTKRTEDDAFLVEMIRTNNTLKIRSEASDNSSQLGYIPKNVLTKPIESENGWHLIEYRNMTGYIKDSDVTHEVVEDMPYDPYEIGYVLNSCPLYGDPELTREIDDINQYEFVEIYELYDKSFLVKADNTIGYVSRKDTKITYNDKVVVFDISDQQVEYYYLCKKEFYAPVVSGNVSKNPKNDHSTGKGEHIIIEKSRNRDLVGPNNSYRSYVNYMMKFNPNGEGLHDASYHKDEKGKNRGWRNVWEFGGDTYKGDGSHGCGNMIYEDAKELYDLVDYDTLVLVKE